MAAQFLRPSRWSLKKLTLRALLPFFLLLRKIYGPGRLGA
jgi:hypothetical protein